MYIESQGQYDLDNLDSLVEKYGLMSLARKVSYALYLKNYNLYSEYSFFNPDDVLIVDSYLLDKYGDSWKRAQKDNHNFYKRLSHLRSFIQKMFDTHLSVQFLTLTFNDDSYNALSDKVKRKYVQQCLKKNAFMYVANVDFGKVTGRLHYHAIAILYDPSTLDGWERYGFYKIEQVRVNDDSKNALSVYVTKFVRHAYKEETRLTDRLIYSRK